MRKLEVAANRLKSETLILSGYDERYPGIPEDMLFFYKHLRLGGGLFKVDRVLWPFEEFLYTDFLLDLTTLSVSSNVNLWWNSSPYTASNESKVQHMLSYVSNCPTA